MRLALIAALVAVSSLALTAPADSAPPIYQVFTTSQSRFTPGADNQGWWSSTMSNNDGNANYVVGGLEREDIYRDFFTFDLSDLTGTVVWAQLRVARYESYGWTTETLVLYDVTTDAATLNFNDGIDPAVFVDLGTGTSYGTFVLPTYLPSHTVARLQLNEAALADINSAAGGFFSIGGRVEDVNVGYLFGNSGSHGPQWLVVQTA